ncbi:E3 ubiquitin-protein ligase rnf146-like [Ornithodoros turicata]|uniref:E3 ubiquitin-protein ligase rnf146-like n=1 Tax=Ornithodoros turicata TaxID=34597 RepID=UPI0031388244
MSVQEPCAASGSNRDTEGTSAADLDCAVCLQKCNHPAKLPCGHVFCFLCVKGISYQNRRCAMCRQVIPREFIEQPELLPEPLPGPEVAFEGYQWFYEGRNGWWQYDERTSTELEAASKRSARRCEVLIAGFIYVIDFDQMVQHRRDHPSRRRRIKRDLISIPKKGIAGIRTEPAAAEDAPTDGAATPSAAEPTCPVPVPEVAAACTVTVARDDVAGSVRGTELHQPTSDALSDHSYVACRSSARVVEELVEEVPALDIVEHAAIRNVVYDLAREEGEVAEVPIRPPSTRRRRAPRRWYYEDFL